MFKVELVIGRMGKGKTTKAYHDARTASANVIIFDPKKQFDDPSVFPHITENPSVLEDLAAQAKFPLVYWPGADLEEEFEDFADVVRGCEGAAVLLDEARLLMNPQGLHKDLGEILRSSRHRSQSLFLTFHRMQQAHGDVLDDATDYVLFGAKGKLALNKIEDYTSEEVRDAVQRLTGKECVHWIVDQEEFFVVKDSRSWFERISKKGAAAVARGEQSARAA